MGCQQDIYQSLSVKIIKKGKMGKTFGTCLLKALPVQSALPLLWCTSNMELSAVFPAGLSSGATSNGSLSVFLVMEVVRWIRSPGITAGAVGWKGACSLG